MGPARAETSRFDSPSCDWHIITCEYPPRVGGVSDYSFSIAGGLAAAGGRVHVWCPAADGPAPAVPGVTVHQELGAFAPRDLRRVGRLLNNVSGPRRLLVQWVPHGYGYRSINVGFAIWLACRAWLRHDELHLMIHEPYLRLSRPLKYLAASVVQRLMLAIIASGAAHIWISIPTWADAVRPYVPRRVPVQWLPVPSPTLRVANTADTAAVRAKSTTHDQPIVGHFSSHSAVVTPLLELALDVVMQRSAAAVLLIGRDSDTFRAKYLATRPTLVRRVSATGVLDSDALSRHLEACELMIQPFPDGINARHTSALASLALGVPVVTNSGPHTEAFWRDSDAVALASAPDGLRVGEAAVDLLQDSSRRAHLADQALKLYDRLFDVRHAISALRVAAASV